MEGVAFPQGLKSEDKKEDWKPLGDRRTGDSAGA